MHDKPVVVSDIDTVRAMCAEARRRGAGVALVPTMGALHRGHLALVEGAKRSGGYVVVCVFVNPTQFGPGEDLGRYPRDIEADQRLLATCGVDLMMTPGTEKMYLPSHCTSIHVDRLTKGLCGAFRPGHFAGVATVVAKLFNIVGPCAAVFGRKDFQQLQVVKAMVRDLNMPVAIIEVPTMRDPDGLAMSSRNAYLAPEERKRALSVSQGLSAAHRLFDAGERRVAALYGAVRDALTAVNGIDYIAIADPDTLEPFETDEATTQRILVALAVHVGKTRLIDNTVLGEDNPPAPI